MGKLAEVKAFLFDLDMTLIDSSYAIHHCTNLLASHLGFSSVSREKVLAAIGLPIGESWISFWGRYEEEWVDYYRANFRKEEEARLRLFPNTQSTLCGLRELGYKTGVVSNRRYAKRPADSTGISPLLDVIVGVESVENPKPKPDALFFGCRELGVLPSEIVYVGDTDIDMITAKAAGTKGIGVTTGNFTRRQLELAGASWVIDDLSEILSFTV